MNPIAIFHHSRMDGGQPPIDPAWSVQVVSEQMDALRESGLADAASEIHIGTHASFELSLILRSRIPEKASFTVHPEGTCSELPTIKMIRDWLPTHRNWIVFYHQSKGVRHPRDQLTTTWRHCMTKHLVYNWRRCVADLAAGHDAVGCHWLTPHVYGTLVKIPLFGGNFWWAKASYLATLPELPITANCRDDFYLAESWIGAGPKRPLIVDYAQHWPSIQHCSRSL